MKKADSRKLTDLVSVGPATKRDFDLLGISSVEQLAKQDAQELYLRLSKLMGQKIDICALDVFCTAVAQAKNPNLPEEQKPWHYWSRLRKSKK